MLDKVFSIISLSLFMYFFVLPLEMLKNNTSFENSIYIFDIYLPMYSCNLSQHTDLERQNDRVKLVQKYSKRNIALGTLF